MDDDIIPMVPISAKSGEGICDLFKTLVEYSQDKLIKILKKNEIFKCKILEVKKIEGLGTTLDLILISGTLKRGDEIIFSGFNGHQISNVNKILTTLPL